MKYQCDNCNEIHEGTACPRITDAAERISYGGPFTDKECPSCGALAYRLPATVIRWRLEGKHVKAAVFMGEDVEHVAHCGILTLEQPEFERLCNAMRGYAENKESPYELVIKEGT